MIKLLSISENNHISSDKNKNKRLKRAFKQVEANDGVGLMRVPHDI